MASMEIRRLCYEDVGQVIGIYVNEFPDNRSTRVGERFLEKMFSWFIENPRALCFVATDNSEVVGFVVGFEGGGYGSRLFRALWPTILMGLIARPNLLFRSKLYANWKNFFRGFFRRRDKKMRKASGRVGIASIAVKSNSKRLGVGSALLDALELEALSRGHTVFCASTKSTNLPAINFYKKKGFEVNPSKGNNMSFVKRL